MAPSTGRSLSLFDLRRANPSGYSTFAYNASVFWERNSVGLSMSLSRYSANLQTEVSHVQQRARLTNGPAGQMILIRMAELSELQPIPASAVLELLTERGQGPLASELRRLIASSGGGDAQ